MSLTQQFLITLTLPAALLGLAFYSWRRQNRRPYLRFWFLALLTGAVWATSILSFYGGVGLPREAAFIWRVISRYSLALLSIWLLLTTISYLSVSRQTARLVLSISAFLWVLTLLLDPAVWSYQLPSFRLGGQQVMHFTFWSAFWVAAWIIPVLGGWLLAWQQVTITPPSLHRNRLNYWLLTLSLFFGGGLLAMVQAPAQPVWQELGALIFILAATVGVVTHYQSQLPELALTFRRLATRLTELLLVFGITTIVFWYLADHFPSRSARSTSLDLIYIAGLFTAIFMSSGRLVRRFVYRLFMGNVTESRVILAGQPELTSSLMHPEQLGELILRLTQTTLAMEEGWLFQAEDGPNGSLLLQTVAGLNSNADSLPSQIQIEGNSAFARQLQEYPPRPLSLYDVERLAAEDLETAPAFQHWPSKWLMPLQAGKHLVGVLALGDKVTGTPYTEEDFTWLEGLAVQAGPLLGQSQNLQRLQEANIRLSQEVQVLNREKHRLEQVNLLYDQFAELIAPSLREPVLQLTAAWQRQQEGEETAPGQVEKELRRLRQTLDNLIHTAYRVRQQRPFEPTEVYLDEIVGQAVRELSAMAEARRVIVKVDGSRRLPAIQADKQRLTEAVHHLLHNAIKFNKIGGTIYVESGRVEDGLFISIQDSGVGIPPERLELRGTENDLVQVHELQRRNPGLGLWLTHFAAQVHGGRLEIDSEYGAGSTFTLYLPLEAA